MTSSKVRKALFLNPRLRISFHTYSMGFISGVYGGINAKPILVGIFKALDLCHIALSVVNLYDLKQMGNKGGCTIQLIHHFPFGMGLGHLKKDYIEFKRVGIFDGKAVEVTLREPYSRDLLQVVKSIKQRQKLIAYRYKEGKLLFVKKEASDVL
ncbi:Tn5253 bacteriocine putative [Streptococcus pneumoniae]|nr:Tn5253 bacteriocine putative [Streptococcus pneumoniae]